MISLDLFTQYVKDALLAFHDAVSLQLSPLVELLRLQQAPGVTATAALRQVLRDTIETLRPAETTPLGRPEWIGYRLLLLRYIRSYSVQATCDELGFSLASFYRYHQRALEALVSLLWERYRQQDVAGVRESSLIQLPSEGQAREEAVKLARESHRQWVDLATAFETAVQILLPLAASRRVVLQIEYPPHLPQTYGDPAMLRQIVLNILTEAIRFASEGTLDLVVSAQGHDSLCCLKGFDSPEAIEALEQGGDIAVSRGLLEVYGGKLWFEKQLEDWVLCFTIPGGKPKSVLVIDDDADTVRLYQRILQAHGYAVRTARSTAELKVQLGEELPDLVLLDVLMPREDGWDVLNYLKKEPATSNVPVVICSVLSQPSLALSLGAEEVLRKPIQEETLIKTVQRVLDRVSRRG